MGHRETQTSIAEWQDVTFGKSARNFRIAVRANEEMAELLRELSLGASPEYDARKAIEECADVYIVLCRLGDRFGVDLLKSSYARNIRDELHFGSKPYEIAAKANLLMARTVLLLSYEIPHKAITEVAAGVVGLLKWIVERLGGNLLDAIDRKMDVNRARTWRLDASGHGYHVKERDRDI